VFDLGWQVDSASVTIGHDRQELSVETTGSALGPHMI